MRGARCEGPDPAARRREWRCRRVMPLAAQAAKQSGERRARGRSRCAKAAPSHARTARPLPMPGRPDPLDPPCVPPLAAPASLTRMLRLPGRPLKKFQQPKQSEKGPRWVKDKAVFWCKLCNTDFSVVVRKHHCRHCGHVFCGCSLSSFACAGTLCCRTASASAGRIQPAAPVCQSTLASEVTHGGGEQTLLFQQAHAHQVWLLEACAPVQQMQRFVLQGRSSAQCGVYIVRRASASARVHGLTPLGSPQKLAR